MLDAATTEAGMTDMARQGQVLMDRLAGLRKPVVAAINGACLGGGLEVALACSYRIATSSPKTKLGLPEVMLGLLPGSGGTQRLPRAVGIQEAISLMTQGKSLDATRARKAGLVHEVVDPHALEAVALAAALELVAGTLKAPKRCGGASAAAAWAAAAIPPASAPPPLQVAELAAVGLGRQSPGAHAPVEPG